MPTIRIGYGSDFVLKNGVVGLGTTVGSTTDGNLELDNGALRANLNVSGVATLTAYGGFVAQKQYVSKPAAIGFGTVGLQTAGVGTAYQYYETETGFTDLGGVHHGDDQRFNTLSEDLVIDDGQILNITNTDMVGVTTIGEYDPHSHSSYVCAGSLEQVSVTGHFSVPSGGTNDRQSFIEGTVRFNTDLNTLEFYNGNEWRQFTYNQGQSGRMLVGGGAGDNSGNIQSININTFGNSVHFGDLTLARSNISSCSSTLRGLWVGGTTPTYQDRIDYVTIASAGGAVDFGNLSTTNRAYLGATSSSTRGIFGGGYTTSPSAQAVNVIDYVEIGTLGNALDFGDMFTGRYTTGSLSNGVRAVWGGGMGNAPTSNTGTRSVIDYVTIASKGDSIKFGDLSVTRRMLGEGACSNNIRGIFAGGQQPALLTVMDYITIATDGNAVYFGDLTEARARTAASSTSTRGLWAGGLNPNNSNVIDYVNIASTGDALDFGDLYLATGVAASCSDSHGGLGGF